MSANPFAGLPLNELERIRADLEEVERAHRRGMKMLGPKFALVNEAIRMANTPADDLLVSDHAIVRWLERIEGMNLQPIRERIQALAAGRYDPDADVEVVVTDEAIIVIRGRKRGEKGTPKSPPGVSTILGPGAELPPKGSLRRPHSETSATWPES